MLALGLDLPAQAGRRRSGAAFDFTGGVLPPGATLTRASGAVRRTASGVLTTDAANVARFDYEPVTHALRGVLIEDAGTNGYLYSEALDQVYWTKSAGVVTADALVAPDGNASADLFVPTAASAVHRVSRATTLVAGTGYVLSFYCRAAGYGFVQLYGGNGTGYGTFYLTADLASGTETAFAAGTSNVIARTVHALDNGWTRVAVALTAIGSGAATAVIAPQTSGTTTRAATSTGDGVRGIALWGLQQETGAGATSYVATGAATATRAADALVLDWQSRGVADGAVAVRYTFDDGTTQDMSATVSGGSAAVPTTLARRWLRRAEKL